MTGLLDGNYRFANFVVGSSNRLAASAAFAVAEAPGSAYNPLFIYGESGVGKTHLVAAIVHQACLAQPDLRVEFSSGEEVAERLHLAIGSGQQEHFTQRYQQVDLLVVDDVQFLAGQRETQSELLRLFNLMQGDGRQLVMTSDRPPAEIPDVDQRLVSRLSGGLIVDVGAPDYEMRLAILRNACSTRSLDFYDGVLEEVARLAFGNVRELKGALNKLTAYQQLEGQGIGPNDVRAVLGERVTPVRVAATASGRQVAGGSEAAGEYEGFLADVFREVETRVEKWRVVLGEACTFWRGEGYVTSVLERAMAHPVQPDVNGLLATFTAAVEHLRALEFKAVAVDPSLRGHGAFRNPETVAEAQALLDRAIAISVPLPAPLVTFSRETFEVGNANQLALTAFDTVVEQPGARYNPLLVQGASGVGKTHLVHALGNALRETWPEKTIACLSAAAFRDELVAAMQGGSVERWRARYRAADVLILDDVQSLADGERTQEELFHLFNQLYERGGQIVLTCDRAPREVHGLADRLRSRFEGGLVVTLQTPDRGLRAEIVERWLREAHAQVTPELVALLADHDVSNVRELGGLFKRVHAAAEMHGLAITFASAQLALGIATPRAHRSAAPRMVAGASDQARLDDFFLDREKVIWDWSDVGARVIEDFR